MRTESDLPPAALVASCYLRARRSRPARWPIALAILAYLWLPGGSNVTGAGADVAAASELDDAFTALTILATGQDLGVLGPIENAVLRAAVDAETQADLETRLLAALAGPGTDLGKQYACRQLGQVGSNRALAPLGALLPDPALSYMARYALEGIGGPGAAQTLRAALSTTTGAPQVGVVISLGRMADPAAVPALATLLDATDPTLRRAAIVALGRIGSADAASALIALRDQAPPDLHGTLITALLGAAEHLSQHGEAAAAVAIAESLQSDPSEQVRGAALRILLTSRPAEMVKHILENLRSDQAWRRAVAADCVRQLDEPGAIEQLAAAVGSLPEPGQLAALHSLSCRKDGAVRAAARQALEHTNPEIRVVALAALASSGTAADAVPLADLAAGTEEASVRAAAFDCLRVLAAPGTNQAIIARMRDRPTLNPTLVKIANLRRSPDFIPALLESARIGDAATRLEAFQALEIMATDQQAAPLVALLCHTAAGPEREAAGRAVWLSCRQISDRAEQSAPVLQALQSADTEGQCALLPVLARLGGAEALGAVQRAMNSPDSSVRDAGYRALANWPDASVADALLEIAKTSEVETYRIWALRAYARVVALPSERAPADTFRLLKDATGLATRAEDRRLCVERMGAVRAPEALAWLMDLAQNPDLRETAVPAAFQVSKGISQSHPEQARAALEQLKSLTQDAALLQQIPKVLADIEKQTRKTP